MKQFKYYDRTYSLTLPSGKTMSPQELADNEIYSALGTIDCAIVVLSDGVTYEWKRLGELKEEYGVSNDDPEAAVNEVNEKIRQAEEEDKELLSSVQEIQMQVDALAGVLSGQA